MKLIFPSLFVFLSMPCIASAAEAVAATHSPNMTRMVISLIVVIGILIMLAVVFKKFGLTRLQSNLPFKIIGAMNVGTNQRIMVIEVGEEWVVLGVTPQQISKITSMPRQETDLIDQATMPAWMQKAFMKKS